MADLTLQMQDYRLTTARIIYHMPDFEGVLQEFLWQNYDLAPQYPSLHKFLNFWEHKIEGKLHSVYIAHQTLITSGDYRFTEWERTLQ